MFDPTAFDNMKVVIEGALYDLDIIGKIEITDRNDIVNMAKMSRYFDLQFKLKDERRTPIFAKIMIESQLVHLAAELIPGLKSENLAGCQIRLEFHFEENLNLNQFHEVQTIALEIWGTNRKITQTVLYHPLDENSAQNILLTIEFDRIVSEEQMDDLIELTDVMVKTIKRLQALLEV
jgi:hypothetical protein